MTPKWLSEFVNDAKLNTEHNLSPEQFKNFFSIVVDKYDSTRRKVVNGPTSLGPNPKNYLKRKLGLKNLESSVKSKMVNYSFI